jgi:hypothetical protein
MPFGYHYQCDACDHEWILFSTRLTLGPIQWGHIQYTCFTCLTFLSVATRVDRNSWNVWLRNNRAYVDSNAGISKLAKEIDSSLESVGNKLTPIVLTFNSILCPTCQNDEMRSDRFYEHPMRCPECHIHTGHYVHDETGITIYGVAEQTDQHDH